MTPLLYRDIYEISTTTTSIHGIMLRGRIRKLCIQKNKNILTENDEKENIVRFAVIHGEEINTISQYIHTLADDIYIQIVAENIPNPILSKLKVNDESRYTL